MRTPMYGVMLDHANGVDLCAVFDREELARNYVSAFGENADLSLRVQPLPLNPHEDFVFREDKAWKVIIKNGTVHSVGASDTPVALGISDDVVFEENSAENGATVQLLASSQKIAEEAALDMFKRMSSN